jgi:hypothetical protein
VKFDRRKSLQHYFQTNFLVNSQGGRRNLGSLVKLLLHGIEKIGKFPFVLKQRAVIS